MIKIEYDNIIALLYLKGKLPQEARPLVKKYCDIMQALIRRDEYLESNEYKEMEIINEYDTLPVDILINQSQLTFKQIIIKYGYTRNTGIAA